MVNAKTKLSWNIRYLNRKYENFKLFTETCFRTNPVGLSPGAGVVNACVVYGPWGFNCLYDLKISKRYLRDFNKQIRSAEAGKYGRIKFVKLAWLVNIYLKEWDGQ